MTYIQLESLSLHTFDKSNRQQLEFIKQLCHDETIKKRFQGITIGLLNNPKNEFFNHGFLVANNNIYIGYIGIGNYDVENKRVYLKSAIDKNKRGNSYGKTLLNEITEYIFKNYPIETINLKIANDNIVSIKTALSCGYQLLETEFYYKTNPYIANKKLCLTKI